MCLMMRYTRVRLTLYIPHLCVMKTGPVRSVFPCICTKWCDVDASCDYKDSIPQTTHTQEVTCQSSRGHVTFIYKNDTKEEASIVLSFLCGQLILQGQKKKFPKLWMIFDSGGHWRCCGSLDETAEGRRSICVLTPITASTATSEEQTEL